MTGQPVTQVRDDIYLVNVVMRAENQQRASLERCNPCKCPLPNGRTVPLSQIARFDYEQEYPLVWRRDRVPTLTVQADVVPGRRQEAVVDTLAPAIASLRESLPKGYSIVVGGTVEEEREIAESVFAMIPAMLFLMLLFLMSQLHRLHPAGHGLALVPMGLIGIVGGAAAVGAAARLRGDSRHARADGNDRAQRGHSVTSRSSRTRRDVNCGMRSSKARSRASGRSCSPRFPPSWGSSRSRQPCSGGRWLSRSWAVCSSRQC